MTANSSTPRYLTPDQAQGWPHTPGKKLFAQAEHAHSRIYNNSRHQGQSDPQPAVPAHVFQLADIFDALAHIHTFRQEAIQEFQGLRILMPDRPACAHMITIALTGYSQSTIGLATAANIADSHTPEPFSFSQLLRETQWLGLDPILPAFAGKHAIILGHPRTALPSAAIGLPDHLIPDDMPGYQPPAQHPETIALATVLHYHGATVHWLNF